MTAPQSYSPIMPLPAQTPGWETFRNPFAGNEGTVSTPLLLSPSHLKTWQRCKKKFAYHVLQQCRWPTDQSNFELGQSVHQLMDNTARQLPIDPLLQSAKPQIVSAYRALQQHPMAQAPILASEWGFTVPVPGVANVWLTGRMDRVVDNNGVLTVVDWKTGTAIPKAPVEDWQTRVYLYALFVAQQALLVTHSLAQPYLVDKLAFTYVGVSRLGDVREVTVPYTQAMHDKTEAGIVALLREIAAESSFALPNRCPDSYCPYRGVCGIEDNPPSEYGLAAPVP